MVRARGRSLPSQVCSGAGREAAIFAFNTPLGVVVGGAYLTTTGRFVARTVTVTP